MCIRKEKYMQHIPHHSLEDIERSREEMAAFMNEKPVCPDLTLTGEDIHRAFCVVDPSEACDWLALPDFLKQKYEAMARELNRELDARQAWTGPFDDEDREISAVRCPSCGQMFTNFKLKEHPCL
jgi:hypothetical protein